nr:type I secretion C-terminal target domain-containing protein [Gellertiella hungarica]
MDYSFAQGDQIDLSQIFTASAISGDISLEARGFVDSYSTGGDTYIRVRLDGTGSWYTVAALNGLVAANEEIVIRYKDKFGVFHTDLV